MTDGSRKAIIDAFEARIRETVASAGLISLEPDVHVPTSG